jgi:hypothetical protein
LLDGQRLHSVGTSDSIDFEEAIKKGIIGKLVDKIVDKKPLKLFVDRIWQN